MGVGGVQRPEAQGVHHGCGTGAHREDVADDPSDTGGRALVGLDVRRVVVALHLERDCVALADVDDARVLADSGEHLADAAGRSRREGPVLGDLGELLEVHLGGLVGAVLAPHHRVHRQLGAGRPAPEDLADAGVLVTLQPEGRPGLLAPGVHGRSGHRVQVGVMSSSVPVGGRDVRFGEGGTGAGVGAGFGHGVKPTWTSAPRRRGTPARCRGPISLFGSAGNALDSRF